MTADAPGGRGERLAEEALLDVLAEEPAATALFMDFDGTLAPIVDVPAAAAPLPGMLVTLQRLATQLAVVAVVSGRPAAFLLERLGPPGALRLFGLYGLEAVQRDGRVALTAAAAVTPELVASLAASARTALPGADVEEKAHSIALHWRRHPADEPALRALATHLAAEAGLVEHAGKMSVELLAPGVPDKGTVVRSLGAGMACCAFAGDDLGDLTAFDALDELASCGARTARIAVGERELPFGLAERADLVLRAPAELQVLLGALSERLRARPR